MQSNNKNTLVESIFNQDYFEKLDKEYNKLNLQDNSHLEKKYHLESLRNHLSGTYRKLKLEEYLQLMKKKDERYFGELLCRFRNYDYGEFLSVLSEIMVGWFIEKILGFSIEIIPKGRNNKILDFKFNFKNNSVFVEVKALIPDTFKPIKTGDGSALGNRWRKIGNAIGTASKQFSKEGTNVLFIVDYLWLKEPDILQEEVFDAFFGQTQFTWIATPAGSNNDIFITRNTKSAKIRKDQNTRLSAVVKLSYDFNPENNFECSVLHNPFAVKTLSNEIFKSFEQYYPKTNH